ncbi:MAG: hypothetical protein ABF311_09925 [Polaribacter sp.]
MAFSNGIERLQQIISFISINYRTKKEIMEHLRDCNIVISYKTLDRDLKQIKQELHLKLEHKRNVGYKIENSSIKNQLDLILDTKNHSIRYENTIFKIINRFEYNDITYCNCIDKSTNKMFLVVEKR